MKNTNLHLISDSTGETLGSISRAVLSQFKDVSVKEYMWSMVRTKSKIEKVVAEIKENPGIVLYTILNKDLLKFLLAECKSENIILVPALKQVTESFSIYLGAKATKTPGRQHVLDEEYFRRIEAINFTINHDDGKKTDDLDEADIILIGPSRTSKSPTCGYLSHRGIKAANVPFISGVELPQIIYNLKKPLIVGLTVNPEILMQIRKNRISMFEKNVVDQNKYTDLDEVKKEVLEAKKIYFNQGWNIIDVTKSSVEETAATIIQKYVKHVAK